MLELLYGKVFPNETNYFNDNPKPDKWEYMRNTCIDVKPYTKTGRKIYICCNRGNWWLFKSRCKRCDWYRNGKDIKKIYR